MPTTRSHRRPAPRSNVSREVRSEATPLGLRHPNRSRLEIRLPPAGPVYLAWCNACHDPVEIVHAGRCAWCELAPAPGEFQRHIHTHRTLPKATRDVHQLERDPHVRNVKRVHEEGEQPGWLVRFEASRPPRFGASRERIRPRGSAGLH
ncbi:MAG: hypothetical protein FJ086_04835 [Deltaproteobacteria bacterium]|nr:hypothetical protein [Deltaproteobacteria bacterium]